MDFLGPFHPQIIHTPIVLIIVSLLFDLVGRAFDLDWWRKAAVAMLVIGVLGAGVAVLSGEAASEVAENRQGIPEETVDHHGDLAKLALWLGIGTLVVRGAAVALGPARPVASGLALVLHLATAVTIGVAAHRGGQLVYQHGAAVHLQGKLITHPPESHDARAGDSAAAPTGPTAHSSH